MTVINSAELRNNMKKNETVVIQRGNKETFVLQKKMIFRKYHRKYRMIFTEQLPERK